MEEKKENSQEEKKKRKIRMLQVVMTHNLEVFTAQQTQTQTQQKAYYIALTALCT